MGKLALSQSHLLWWAKFICEEEQARIQHDPELAPSWLNELQAICDEVEDNGGEALEP